MSLHIRGADAAADAADCPQQEGLFALGNPEVAAQLELTDAQRARLSAIVQETQKRFQGLQAKARSGGRPERIEQEAAELRRAQEKKVEAFLTRPQRDRWKSMLGRPLPLDT